VLKTKSRNVATLAIGEFLAREFHYRCRRCGREVGSKKLRALVPTGCTFGYDVLVRVGKAFFLESRNNGQIVDELRERNVKLSRSEVSYLARKFVIHLALLHTRMRKETKGFLGMNGGYILHLDGTCEGESPHLISVLDGITEIVLDNVKLPSENAEELIPFLQGIKDSYGEPLAVVTDMSKAFLRALGEVFKHVPLFICHFHFLKNAGRELFGEENDTIRNRLSNHGIQGILRTRVRALNGWIAQGPQVDDTFLEGIETGNLVEVRSLEALPQLAVRALLVWVLEGKHQGQGRGFPFDQPYLAFYRRLIAASTLLAQCGESGFFASKAEKKLYRTIRDDLLAVERDSVLSKTADTMQEKVQVFDRLRAAMRITLPENKRGLNDDGELCTMKTIKKEVTKFKGWLSRQAKRMKDNAYRKMIGLLDKYWDMLFCDPIVVQTEAGKFIIQPQRTNNILEQFFRNIMRTYRKKNGFQAMEKILKAMPENTPLVMNLRNKDFMEVLLAGKSDLAQRFADIDAQIVRQEMNRLTECCLPA
jgi:ribosomal protein L37E